MDSPKIRSAFCNIGRGDEGLLDSFFRNTFCAHSSALNLSSAEPNVSMSCVYICVNRFSKKARFERDAQNVDMFGRGS